MTVTFERFLLHTKAIKTIGEDHKGPRAKCMRRIYSAFVRVVLSHAFLVFFHAIVRSFVQNTPIESLTRDNLEIRTHRSGDNFRAAGARGEEGGGEKREGEVRESLLRRFVRISRPRPDSNDWFYVETANGSGPKICRPNLPVSVASGA